MIHLSFTGQSLTEIHDAIKAYAKEHFRKAGRPKFTPDQHLGKQDEISPADLQEITRQILHDEGLGYSVLEEILNSFEARDISELPKRHWDRFIRICKSKIDGNGI